MKSLKKIEKKYTPEEIAESFVFPGPKTSKERSELLEAFREHRKKLSVKQSDKNLKPHFATVSIEIFD